MHCPICLGPIYRPNDEYSWPCNHVLHLGCAVDYVHRRGDAVCPVCRATPDPLMLPRMQVLAARYGIVPRPPDMNEESESEPPVLAAAPIDIVPVCCMRESEDNRMEWSPWMSPDGVHHLEWTCAVCHRILPLHHPRLTAERRYMRDVFVATCIGHVPALLFDAQGVCGSDIVCSTQGSIDETPFRVNHHEFHLGYIEPEIENVIYVEDDSLPTVDDHDVSVPAPHADEPAGSVPAPLADEPAGSDGGAEGAAPATDPVVDECLHMLHNIANSGIEADAAMEDDCDSDVDMCLAALARIGSS